MQYVTALLQFHSILASINVLPQNNADDHYNEQWASHKTGI